MNNWENATKEEFRAWVASLRTNVTIHPSLLIGVRKWDPVLADLLVAFQAAGEDIGHYIRQRLG